MKKVIIHIMPIFFTVLFGIFDAAQTARKDYPEKSIFWNHSIEDWHYLNKTFTDSSFRLNVLKGETKFTSFDLWYIGGNQFYNPPRYFWTSDFWHAMKNLWVLCITGIGISCMAVGTYFWQKYNNLMPKDRWKMLSYSLYFFLYWIEGLTFVLFYHTIFLQ